jgi:lactococcin 972 family bacteriocin
MKRVKQGIFAAAASAVMLLSGAGVAQAEPLGLVAIEEDGCQDVDGGTWCYGSGIDGSSGLKACYSNYKHPDNVHSATAMIGNSVNTVTAGPGDWAQAWATAGWGFTCHAKYNPDA